MEILFYRHGRLKREDESTLEDAKEMLRAIEDGESGYAVGIYDSTTNKFYYTDNSVIGQDLAGNLEMKKRDLEKIGLHPTSFELYEAVEKGIKF